MFFGDNWLKLNTENFAYLDSISEQDLSENAEWLKLLNIFDKNASKSIDYGDAVSLWSRVKSVKMSCVKHIPVEDAITKILEQKMDINGEHKSLKEEGITVEGLRSFLSIISKRFHLSEKPAETAAETSEKAFDNTKRAVESSSWENFMKKNRVKPIEVGDSTVYACGWCRFDKSPEIWIDLQTCMIQAAEELDLTLVYSDGNRSKAVSDKANQQKPGVAVKGGQSPHNYGVAADILLFSGGKILAQNSELYKAFTERVKELSGDQILWGGDFKNKEKAKVEKHHFELRGWQEMKKNNELKLIG